jgi:hypothetical protein
MGTPPGHPLPGAGSGSVRARLTPPAYQRPRDQHRTPADYGPRSRVGDTSAIIGPYLRLLEGRQCLPLERSSKT